MFSKLEHKERPTIERLPALLRAGVRLFPGEPSSSVSPFLPGLSVPDSQTCGIPILASCVLPGNPHTICCWEQLRTSHTTSAQHTAPSQTSSVRCGLPAHARIQHLCTEVYALVPGPPHHLTDNLCCFSDLLFSQPWMSPQLIPEEAKGVRLPPLRC